ncbi:hypothetical protein BS638_00240 [Clostridium tepidum]|uniref:Uncharacterized protein n=1 Tax=Clostridium tepidum TaxID=1962263 RepID=A0A1S9IHX2_9CLOT|nr:hypothetical protein BS637_06995 [Clostridium tepidum]OOO69853.1 hypothetical protein BS638_00240 [Clostridium tepidum]
MRGSLYFPEVYKLLYRDVTVLYSNNNYFEEEIFQLDRNVTSLYFHFEKEGNIRAGNYGIKIALILI